MLDFGNIKRTILKWGFRFDGEQVSEKNMFIYRKLHAVFQYCISPHSRPLLAVNI